jgi:hypothetical protein
MMVIELPCLQIRCISHVSFICHLLSFSMPGWSFYWVIFGLVESVFVGYLFFIRQDKATKEMYRRRANMTGQSPDDIAYNGVEVPRVSSPAADALPKLNEEDDIYYVDDMDDESVRQSVAMNPNRFSSTKTIGRNATTKTAITTTTTSGLSNGGSSVGVDSDSTKNSNDEKKTSSDLEVIEGDAETAHQPSLVTNTNSSNKTKTTATTPVSPRKWNRWIYTVSLRRIDHFCFFLTIISYTAFIVAMFVTGQYDHESQHVFL